MGVQVDLIKLDTWLMGYRRVSTANLQPKLVMTDGFSAATHAAWKRRHTVKFWKNSRMTKRYKGSFVQ
jgi:hypothetical protein